MTTKQKITSFIGGAVIVAGAILVNKAPEKVITHSSHWKIIPSGSYWNYPFVKGDTLVLNGTYGYIGFDHKDSGIITWVNATMTNGFAFKDCKNWHLFGKLGGLQINSHNANPTNTAIDIEGKSGGFEIGGVDIDSAAYFIKFKTDPQYYPNDSSYWTSLNMDGFHFYNFDCNYAKQDGFYLGNTDVDGKIYFKGYGENWWHPVPGSVSNVRIEHGRITNTQRQGIQLSLARTGINFINDCYIENTGFEWSLNHQSTSLYQGAGIALGKYTIVKEIARDTIKNTFLNNLYSYATGKVKITDCVFDSADIVWGVRNPQPNASVLLSAITPISMYKIRNNKIGWSNNGVGIVVYGAKSVISDTGNVIVNSGNFINNSLATFKSTE